MNVIVANKYQTLLTNLDIDVIKNINGEFTINELVAQFSNFYFNKMIIDVTALKGYEDINVIQDLSLSLDMTKVILLLDDSPRVNSPMYLSQLVSMGIYNFTRNIDTVKFLIDNPNTYKDVAQFHNLNGFKAPKLNDTSVDMSKGNINKRVIGFKNVTDNAGSTTLVYLLKKHLEKYYKVKAVEVDGTDFSLLNDHSLESITGSNLQTYIANNSKFDVILVDLNSDYDSSCDEVVYLIEPGLIKLNKLIRKNNNIFNELEGKKVVLNKSVLNDKDINDFVSESGCDIFYNLPCLDDKLDDQNVINDFLLALGFSRAESSKDGLFSIFK